MLPQLDLSVTVVSAELKGETAEMRALQLGAKKEIVYIALLSDHFNVNCV